MKIGFIGIGSMGQPIANNLLRAGFELKVYNRTPDRSAALAAQGAVQVPSPAAAADGVEVVVTMLSDDKAVSDVVLGQRALLAAMAPGTVHLGMSTIGVGLSRTLAEAHRAAGQGYVAAPVFGRPAAATVADLTFAIAGPADEVARCLPLLRATGRNIYHLGSEPHRANYVKLACNFLIASVIETLGEALALLRGSGVDSAEFVSFLHAYELRGSMIERYGRLIADGKCAAVGFPVRLGRKDLQLVLTAAEEQGLSLPLARLLEERFGFAMHRGQGDADWSSLARLSLER